MRFHATMLVLTGAAYVSTMLTKSLLAAGSVLHEKSLLCFLLVVSALGLGVEARSAEPPPAKKTNVLFVPWPDDPIRFADRVARELAAERFVAAGHNSLGDLTLDYLRQFHAVVIYQDTGDNESLRAQYENPSRRSVLT